VFITAVPSTKLFAWEGGETMEDMYYERLRAEACVDGVCVCLLLQDLVQSCSRGGVGGIWEDMCYERRRAEACVD
jgi:hypothetical protein